MALNLNGNSPKKILFNGLNVAKVLFNGVVVWIAKILQFLSGYPLTLENSTGENLVDYKIYGNQDPEAIILPDEYVRLDYIESTGTQYINTKAQIFNYENHEIVVDFMPTSFYNYNTIWGSTFDENTYEAWIYYHGELAARYNMVRYGTDNTLKVNNRYLFDLKREGTQLSKYVNGVSYGTGTAATRLTTADFLLFLSSDDYGKYKLYSCKLYADGDLVRNFVPSYRKSDSVIGLYDLVENKFYSNSGIGDFVAGREITTKVGKVGDEYYKAGEQLYKIPIKVSNDTETEYEIYLNKPLGKIKENADYIDFENQEVAYYDYSTDTYTKENIELPEIPTQKGTNIITVETSLKPSKMDIKYYKKGV